MKCAFLLFKISSPLHKKNLHCFYNVTKWWFPILYFLCGVVISLEGALNQIVCSYNVYYIIEVVVLLSVVLSTNGVLSNVILPSAVLLTL